ncbi:MAG TPA: HlyD family efflux transporter periplasmic adaptor subunit, partial [Steroidobacteraceae bacterium]|nr:HlyD family efflux transporter periplasmic adaptor subunit [Steroidobacteraceae bacterium]
MDIIETTELPPQGQKQGGMDRQIPLGKWPWSVLSPGAKLALVATLSVLVILLLLFFILGGGTRTLRIPLNQVTSATVERGVFHDLIPLRANVVPRDTVYVDAMDGGRVDRVLVQAGDVVEAGQPMIVLSNTNLALQVIQQESQLNQAISQLQQNEISLEQNQLANQRSLADIDYNLIRLQRAAKRRNDLATRGMLSVEERDTVTDELAYYQKLRPIQSESGQRQSALYERLLPEIDRQLQNLRGNLTVVHDKLDSLVVRAPVSGKVTALDLKVGENLGAGQRLAEVTPDTGMKLEADID